MRLGHKLDEYTLALWRMDEKSAADSLTDAKGARDLAGANAPGVVAGRIGGGRSFVTASAQGFSLAHTDSAWMEALRGSFTAECWVNLGGVTPPTTGTLLYQNSRFSIVVLTTRVVRFWANSSLLDATSVPLSSTGWSHVALRVTSNGTNRTVEGFINGVLVGTLTAQAIPSVSNSGTIRIGSIFNADYLSGSLDDARISSVARADWEILESYQRGMGLVGETLGHKLDGDTLALWRFDEGAGHHAADATGSFPLIHNNGDPPETRPTILATAGRIGGGRIFTSGAQQFFICAATVPLKTIFLGADYTAEAWVHIGSANPPSQQTVFSQGTSATAGSTTAQTAALRIQSDGKFNFGWAAASAVSTANVPLNQWNHLAARVTVTGGGATRTVELFLNGVAAGSTAGLTAPTGGATGTLRVGHFSTGTQQYYGAVDDLRISKVLRTNAEILESVNRGIGKGHTKLGHIADGDTLALWRLDEDSGAATAYALPNTAPTRSLPEAGSPVPPVVTGQIGSGRTVGGTGRLIRSVSTDTGLDAAHKTGSFTWELWVNYNGTNPTALSFIGGISSNVFALATEASRNIRVYVGSGNVNSAAGVVPQTGWHHVAARVAVNGSSRDVTLFVNGVSVLATSITPAFGSIGFLYLGNTGGTNANNISVDDVRISAVARTDEEIMDSYQRGLGLVSVSNAPKGRTQRFPLRRAGGARSLGRVT